MAQAYMVLHQVGTAAPGEVITFTEAQTAAPTRDGKGGLGIDVERLKALGAIREAEGDEAKSAHESGSSAVDALVPFPTVPFEATPTTPDPADVDERTALSTGASGTDDEGNLQPATAATVKAVSKK
jgi:hypothetical protein